VQLVRYILECMFSLFHCEDRPRKGSQGGHLCFDLVEMVSRVYALSNRVTSLLQTFQVPSNFIKMVLPVNFVNGVLKVL